MVLKLFLTIKRNLEAQSKEAAANSSSSLSHISRWQQNAAESPTERSAVNVKLWVLWAKDLNKKQNNPMRIGIMSCNGRVGAVQRS